MAITDNLPNPDDARDQIRELRAQVEQLMSQRVTPALSSAAGYAEDYSKKARAITADSADKVSERVRDQPLIAILVAAGLGYLVGRISA